MLLIGLAAYRLLPLSALPNVESPTLQVVARLPGAGPETMATAVASVLERRLSGISGLEEMSSTSDPGMTRVTLRFAFGRDIDAAERDVHATIAAAASDLPATMPAPSLRRVNPVDLPVLRLALTSDRLPLSAVNQYGEMHLAARITAISGVALVQVHGRHRYAVRVRLDPHALAARGVGIDEVEGALREAMQGLPVDTPDRGAEALRRIIVTHRADTPVELRNVAQVADSVENTKVAAWFNDRRAIVLAIYRKPGANTVELVERIRQQLPAFRTEAPASIDIHPLSDRAGAIRDSVRAGRFTLALSITLALLAIFLFLRNLPATMLPLLALPICVIGTFPVMFLFGSSLNSISLLALTLCLGFAVGDAVVTYESVKSHLKQGKSVAQAAVDGAREITPTILLMSLSLVAAFVPMLLMPGSFGQLVNELAATIVTVILISGLVSLTLTPVAASCFLKPGQKAARSHMAFQRAPHALRQIYASVLRWTLRHQRAAVAVFAAMCLATAAVVAKAPKGLLPGGDMGELFAFVEGPPRVSLKAMASLQREVAGVIARDANVQGVISVVGPSGLSPSLHSGRTTIVLKPFSERQPPQDVIQDLRQKLANISGTKVFIHNVPAMPIGTLLSRSPHQYVLRGRSTEQLYEWAPRVEERLRTLPGLVDVLSDLIVRPRVDVAMDREGASAHAVSAQQVDRALWSAYGSRRVATMHTAAGTHSIILELAPRFQADPSVMSMLAVRSSTGTLVPLDSVAKLSYGAGPLRVTRLGEATAVPISFDLAPGVALSQAIGQVEAAIREMDLPPGLAGAFWGTPRVYQDSVRTLAGLVGLAILAMYVVLGIRYESFTYPLIVLGGLPAVAFGSLLAVGLSGMAVDLYAFVGMMAAMGLAVRTAIAMLDTAIRQQAAAWLRPGQAIYRAALMWFRPGMMTSAAVLAISLAIAIGSWSTGAGSEPLALALAGGLVVSHIFAILITPVIYVCVAKSRGI